MSRRRIRNATYLLISVVVSMVLSAQSPEARLRVLVTTPEGTALPRAEVTVLIADRGIRAAQKTGADGICLFGALPPGVYTISATLPGYITHSRQGIKLDVAERQDMSFVLEREPGGSSETGQLMKGFLEATPPVPVLGVETVASSVSVVVDEEQIFQLPLLNRNVYSLFLLQPGVTSQEASEARGLRFSVHGQRVSGSNYLLDGVDNNNITITGPVTITSLESTQEFRMINSSFSADTGRATSFVAQVITTPGSNTLHGGIFGYFSNDALNANTFYNNSFCYAKMPLHELQTGYSLGGPILRNRTYFFTSLERLRLRFSTNQQITVPTPAFIANLPPDSPFRQLFASTPPFPVSPSPDDPKYGSATLELPNRLDTLLFTGRVDHNLHAGRDRLISRYSLSMTKQELSDDSGYPALWPTDRFNGHNAMVGWIHTFEDGPVNDLRLGWNRYRPDFPRPFDDRPILAVPGQSIDLASSSRPGDQHENDNVLQFIDNFVHRRGRSSITMGFEIWRNLENGVNQGLENSAYGGQGVLAAGLLYFADLTAVQADEPFVFGVAVDRFARPLQLADLDRSYRSTDYAAFFEDNLKLNRRLSVDIGLRWEHFGVVHNTDRSKDVNLYFGPGSTIEERIANGVLRPTTENPGDLKGLLYRPQWKNFSPSVGLAWDPFGHGQTVVRAGYALAYDRIYNQALDVRTNSSQSIACFPPDCAQMMLPVQLMLPGIPLPLPFPTPVVIIDQNLKTPYAENWHFGIQHSITRSLLLQLGHSGSVGRKLASRDEVNRTQPSAANTEQDNFITNQGNSNYLSFETGITQRLRHGLQYQLSYTWSHIIDNQSDLLEGVRIGPDRADVAIAGFTSMLDPRFDRASANFDQRHNFIVNAIWEIPAPPSRWNTLIGGWSLSGIAGIRSGFPVTVISSAGVNDAGFLNPHANPVGNPGSFQQYQVRGGRQWLSPIDFSPPLDGPGILGRNALSGPGSWNCDLAVMRRFSFKDSRLHLQFRGEFYNAFNHANLSPPVSQLGNTNFGVSYAGFSQSFSRFGELPLDNVSRQIQLAFRLSF